MVPSGQAIPFTGGPNSWLREEQLLKIHLELTLLINRAGLPWEDSEEIAGECLVALWIEYELTGCPYPIKPFLWTRMEKLVQEHHQAIQLRKEVEAFYLSILETETLSEKNEQRRLALISNELLSLLQTEEQAVLQALLLSGMDLPAIAAAFGYPLSKVRRHYKHGIFRLQKFLGLWKKMR